MKTLLYDTIETPKSGKNLGGKPGCVRCDAKVNLDKCKWVHVIGGGGMVLHPDSESEYVSDAADLYMHPVGPECAKFFGDFARK